MILGQSPPGAISATPPARLRALGIKVMRTRGVRGRSRRRR